MAFATYAQKPSAFIITNEDDTIHMYTLSDKEDVIVWDERGGFKYRDENGKKQYYHGWVKVLINGPEMYLPLKKWEGKKPGHQQMKILAFSDKYVLAAIIGGMDRVYVYDRDFTVIEKYMSFGMSNKGARKKSVKKVEKYITKYFTDCPYVTENFIKNINGESYKVSAGGNKHAFLSKGFDAYRCGDAEPIIYFNLRNEGGIKIRKFD